MYGGEFRVRILPLVHRSPAMQAKEQGLNLNRSGSFEAGGFGVMGWGISFGLNPHFDPLCVCGRSDGTGAEAREAVRHIV